MQNTSTHLSDDPITVIIAIIFTLFTVLIRNLWPTSIPTESGKATVDQKKVDGGTNQVPQCKDYIENKEWKDIKELCEKTVSDYIKNSEDMYANKSGYHFAPGSDEPSIHIKDNEYSTIIEDHYAEDYPSVKPHYE